jgi:hypothetical protein
MSAIPDPSREDLSEMKPTQRVISAQNVKLIPSTIEI